LRDWAKHWRSRAAELRQFAETTENHATKEALFRLAGECEALARHAAEREASPGQASE
jgi:hypothetical protein